MKILTKSREYVNLMSETGRDSDIYDARLTHGLATLIDEDENILDVFPRVMLRYTIDEAGDLLDAMRKSWPDYTEDPYYESDMVVYPGRANIEGHDAIDIRHWTRNISLYRYKVAGEWIYGITTRFTPDSPPDKFIEGSFKGWEKWLNDHYRVISQAWIARHH